jgi:TetR/AcrR family transcriptional regulator, cholesterol catabolism regulator
MAVAEATPHRRDQMLTAAAELFSERGYHGTSMQHLAERLGILRGSLYAHIASKEDLLFEIVDRGADRFITRMEEVVASEASPPDKLRNALAAHIATVAEHMEASTVFLNDWRFLSGERREIIQAKRDLYESLVQEIIEEGIEWGVFNEELDPRFATIFVLSTANWLYQWYRPDGSLTPEDIATRFSELIQEGLRKEAK